jgi:hypothetical protein
MLIAISLIANAQWKSTDFGNSFTRPFNSNKNEQQLLCFSIKKMRILTVVPTSPSGITLPVHSKLFPLRLI